MSSLSLSAYLLLLVRFTLAVVSIGIEVQPSNPDSADLITEVNLLHHELYSIDDEAKYESKVTVIQDKLDKVVGGYLSKHSCVRYYLKEYFTYNDDEIDGNLNNGLFVNCHFTFDNLDWDSRRQYMNVLFLDKKANVLRKINKHNDNALNVLIDYPLVDKSEQYFNEQYFDVCLENVQYDKSWNNALRVVDAYIDFSFGLEAISTKYQKSSEMVISVSENFAKVNDEIDRVLNLYLENLKTSEPELRNKNEDTLSKYMICFATIFVIFVIVNIFQITWLIKYLKAHGLL